VNAAIRGPDAFRRAFGVSRETADALARYHDLLLRWNRRINLVGRGTEAEAWHRHFADSAQLWPLAPRDARLWLDLGSGAGFPGLVIAILARERGAPAVALVESDLRKCAFLATAAREIGIDVALHCTRIETLPPQRADVVSGRALAPLAGLIGYAEKHLAPGGLCLFPKGETVHKEVEEAKRIWRFDHQIHQSSTAANSAIVEIGAIHGARP
jgi:16S rRNA (guanine527-N7)-methyltransferase